MDCVDRYGDKFTEESGSANFTVFTSTGKVSWIKKGDVVQYLIDITLSSSSGGHYEFTNLIPYKHMHTYGVLSSWVGNTDIRQYGDFQLTAGKSLIMDLPKYGSALTIRGSVTAIIRD